MMINLIFGLVDIVFFGLYFLHTFLRSNSDKLVMYFVSLISPLMFYKFNTIFESLLYLFSSLTFLWYGKMCKYIFDFDIFEKTIFLYYMINLFFILIYILISFDILINFDSKYEKRYNLYFLYCIILKLCCFIILKEIFQIFFVVEFMIKLFLLNYFYSVINTSKIKTSKNLFEY